MQVPRDGTLTMLLAEDEPSVTLALTAFFSARGWRVRGARSLTEALALVSIAEFELAVLDLRLGDDTDAGLTLARAIAARRPAARTILLSGYSSHLAAGEAEAAGVDLVLAKPVRLPSLRAAAEELLARRRDPARPEAPASQESRGGRR